MSYCTVQDLIDRFGERELIQITDRDCQDVINQAVLAQAIADAEVEINSYISRWLPLQSVSDNLTRIACNFTRYYLYDDKMIDEVRVRYEDGRRYLEQLATGKIPFPGSSDGEAPPQPVNSNEVVFINGDGGVFNRNRDW